MNFDLSPSNCNRFTLGYLWMFLPNLRKSCSSQAFLTDHVQNGDGWMSRLEKLHKHTHSVSHTHTHTQSVWKRSVQTETPPPVSLELFETKRIFVVHIWPQPALLPLCLSPTPAITDWYSLYWPCASSTQHTRVTRTHTHMYTHTEQPKHKALPIWMRPCNWLPDL